MISSLKPDSADFLNTVGWFQAFLCISNNSNKRQSYADTQLNYQTVLFLKTQLSISHLFALSLNVKQFYLSQRSDHISCYNSRLECTWGWWQLRGTPHSLVLQLYWSLTIKLYSVIFMTFVEEMQLIWSTAPIDRAMTCLVTSFFHR